MSLLKALKLPAGPGTAAPVAGHTATPAAKGREKTAATPAAAASPAAAARLTKAADAWRQAERDVAAAVQDVKAAARQQCAGLPPAFAASLDKGLAKFDAIVAQVEGGLADVLAAAASADDDTARKTQLAEARKRVKALAGYVQGEKLIGLVDANPWGVSAGVRKSLVSGLQAVGGAIG